MASRALPIADSLSGGLKGLAIGYHETLSTRKGGMARMRAILDHSRCGGGAPSLAGEHPIV